MFAERGFTCRVPSGGIKNYPHHEKTHLSAFSHDRTAAILVFQNNKTAAMMVYQVNLVGIELFSYVKTFFCSNESA